MAYSTLGWQNGQAPAINASNLNHMDQGIADADAAATAAATLAGQKMDKISGGTAGDFAALDANGNVVDSGKSASDFAPSSETGYVVRQTTTASTPRAYTYSRDGGDSYLPVIRAESTPESIVQRTVGGQIVTGYPTVSSHAATKGYVDAYAVPKTTLTYKVYGTNQNGSQVTLDFAGNSASANSIARRTSGGQLYVAAPIDNGHAANKQYVDGRVQANPTNAATTDLTKLKVGSTTYNIPSGGVSAGVSSIGNATGDIILGTGMSMSGQTLNGPDTSSFLQKKTTTNPTQFVYGFTFSEVTQESIQNSPQVSSGATSGSSIVARIGGKIKCAAPDGTDNNHVVTLGYANYNYAPKATNGYAELDANGAVQGLKDVFVDFGGKALGTNTLIEGKKLYNSISTYGFSFIANGRNFDNTHDINPQIVVSKGTGVHDGIRFTYTFINAATISIDDFDYEVLSTGDISRNQV